MAIGELNARRAALSRIKGGRLAARLVRPRGPGAVRVGRARRRPAGDRLRAHGAARRRRRPRRAHGGGQRRSRRGGSRRRGGALRSHGAAPRRGASQTMPRALRRASRTSCISRRHSCCVWGGESTVQLPAHPGRGGRNQHLALAAARLIAGHAELLLLAAGTDGSDGVTDGRRCARRRRHLRAHHTRGSSTPIAACNRRTQAVRSPRAAICCIPAPPAPTSGTW